jgi:uncharacterized membrane protein YuzA (DUF378 family)
MTGNWIGPAATALGAMVAASVGGITVASGVASLTVEARIRASVRRDQAILKELRSESRAAQDLRGSIELRIEKLVDLELLGRDPGYRWQGLAVQHSRLALLGGIVLSSIAYFVLSAKLVKRFIGDGEMDSTAAIFVVVGVCALTVTFSAFQLRSQRSRLDRVAAKVLRTSARPRGHLDEPGVVELGSKSDSARGTASLLSDDDVHLPRPR